MRLKFNPKFLIPFLAIFLIEITIALFINDSFVRPILGDVLVVVLMYFFVRMVTNIDHLPTVMGVFVFSCLVEIMQFFHLIDYLKLQDSKLAQTVLGTTFSVMDFFAYFTGALLILILPIVFRLMQKNK